MRIAGTAKQSKAQKESFRRCKQEQELEQQQLNVSHRNAPITTKRRN